MLVFKYLIDNLKFLFMPTYWLMKNSFNKEWDTFLNRCFDKEMYFTGIGNHTAELDGKTIWIENHPYASFTLRNNSSFRPSRKTIFRAHAILVTSLINQEK